MYTELCVRILFLLTLASSLLFDLEADMAVVEEDKDESRDSDGGDDSQDDQSNTRLTSLSIPISISSFTLLVQSRRIL